MEEALPEIHLAEHWRSGDLSLLPIDMPMEVEKEVQAILEYSRQIHDPILEAHRNTCHQSVIDYISGQDSLPKP